MKKIFAFALAMVSTVSMFAAINSNLHIYLDKGLTNEVEAFVASGDTYSPFNAGACGTYFNPMLNPSNMGVYMPYLGTNYSVLNVPEITNVPLVLITSIDATQDDYELYFEFVNAGDNTETIYLTDLRPDGGGAPVTIPLNDATSYPFSLENDYVTGTHTVVADRFVLNYTATYLKGSWDGWTDAIEFIPQGDGTGKATLDMSAKGEGYYTFKVNEGANWYGNTTTFKRDYLSESGIVNNEDMTFWMDAKGDYTFTWNYASNTITLEYPTLPTVQMKGSWDSWADFVDFTPAADGLTASANLHLDPADWYQFKVALNGTDWRSFEYVDDATSPFTRTNNSHNWINADHANNMTINADQAGDYTFTWTFATNTLTITFPAVAPANTVTTNSNGFLSFASTEDVEFLGGLKAYRGQYNAGTNELTLYEIGTKVPANTGVILWNSNGTAETFNYTTGADVSGVTVGTNNFVGVTTAADPAAIRATGKEIYCLNGNALKQYVGTDDIPAGKAYLPISVGGGSNNAPKHITMRFNNTTAVDNLDVEAGNVEKFIENGQIFIRRGNEVFNMQGQIVK